MNGCCLCPSSNSYVTCVGSIPTTKIALSEVSNGNKVNGMEHVVKFEVGVFFFPLLFSLNCGHFFFWFPCWVSQISNLSSFFFNCDHHFLIGFYFFILFLFIFLFHPFSFGFIWFLYQIWHLFLYIFNHFLNLFIFLIFPYNSLFYFFIQFWSLFF